jgi:beta-glucosidase
MASSAYVWKAQLLKLATLLCALGVVISHPGPVQHMAETSMQLPRAVEGDQLPYRDAELSISERVDDLLQRMTIEEKAGQLFHSMLFPGANGTLDAGNVTQRRNSTEFMLKTQLLSHFNLVGAVTNATETAEFINLVQKTALETRLGIPVTMSSDPRHAFTENIGTGFTAGQFSQWPESLGLAALRSSELVEQFADIARQEYLAVGLRCALHPQIDLSTEPRWSRISNTMGEDAELTSELVVAYLKGFQGGTFGKQSISTVTKHFPGAVR